MYRVLFLTMYYIFPTLNKENILSRISEWDIFRYYSDNFKRPNKKFKSDFRLEEIGSCSISNYKGKIIYRDFGLCETYDCFAYVQKKYKCSFIEALNIINKDFNLSLDYDTSGSNVNKVPIISNEIHDKIYTGRSTIRVLYREWDEAHVQYMLDHKLDYKYVSNKFNVNPIEYFWLNDVQYKAQKLAFAYYFGVKDEKYIYKVYQPLAKKGKWFHNLTEDILQGYDQLPESGEKVILTKAYKDVWCYDSHNLPSFATGAEGWDIPDWLMDLVAERFPIRLIGYDFDYSGLKGMNHLKRRYGLKPFVIIKEGSSHYKMIKNVEYVDVKDFADYCKLNSYEFVENKIKELL